MARCPEAGKAKTRLIPTLGPDGAASLHSCLVKHTLRTVRAFAEQSGSGIDVQFAGGNTEEMCRLFGDDLQLATQQGESLGDRMNFAVGKAFADGCHRVIVIGTDCPQLQPNHLQRAFSSLLQSDVTIGPVIDGGYYLIGMRERIPELFKDIRCGSDSVLKETLQRVKQVWKSKTLLPMLSGVDFPEDLVFCRLFPEAFTPALPQSEKGLLSGRSGIAWNQVTRPVRSGFALTTPAGLIDLSSSERTCDHAGCSCLMAIRACSSDRRPSMR